MPGSWAAWTDLSDDWRWLAHLSPHALPPAARAAAAALLAAAAARAAAARVPRAGPLAGGLGLLAGWLTLGLSSAADIAEPGPLARLAPVAAATLAVLLAGPALPRLRPLAPFLLGALSGWWLAGAPTRLQHLAREAAPHEPTSWRGLAWSPRLWLASLRDAPLWDAQLWDAQLWDAQLWHAPLWHTPLWQALAPALALGLAVSLAARRLGLVPAAAAARARPAPPRHASPAGAPPGLPLAAALALCGSLLACGATRLPPPAGPTALAAALVVLAAALVCGPAASPGLVPGLLATALATLLASHPHLSDWPRDAAALSPLAVLLAAPRLPRRWPARPLLAAAAAVALTWLLARVTP